MSHLHIQRDRILAGGRARTFDLNQRNQQHRSRSRSVIAVPKRSSYGSASSSQHVEQASHLASQSNTLIWADRPGRYDSKSPPIPSTCARRPQFRQGTAPASRSQDQAAHANASATPRSSRTFVTAPSGTLRRSPAVRHDANQRPTHSEKISALATSYQAILPLVRYAKKYTPGPSAKAKELQRRSTTPSDPYSGLTHQRWGDVARHPRTQTASSVQRHRSREAALECAGDERQEGRSRSKDNVVQPRAPDDGSVQIPSLGGSDSLVWSRKTRLKPSQSVTHG